MENEWFLSMNEIRTLQQKDFVIWANKIIAETGITQKELAKTIGCEVTYLSNLLNFRVARKGSKWNKKIKHTLIEVSQDHSLVV